MTEVQGSSSPENLDKDSLLESLKYEINDLRGSIEDPTSFLNQDDLKSKLSNLLRVLESDIDDNNRDRFNSISEKLESSENLESSDIWGIVEILEHLEAKDTLQVSLESLNQKVQGLKRTRSSLIYLQQWIQLPPALREKKEKLESYFDRLKSFKTSHPIRTKALLMMLPASLLPFFKKEETSSVPVTWTLWQIKSFVDSIWDGISDIFARVATIFFSFFAPKEMKELLAKIQELAWDLDLADINSLKSLWTGAAAVWALVWDAVSEELPDMEKMKLKMRQYIRWFVERNFKKNIKPETLDKVIEDMRLEEFKTPKDLKQFWNFLNWSVDASWNLIDWVVESAIMPFKFFFRLMDSLSKNNVAGWWDVSMSAWRNILKYATKPIALFNVGSWVVLGKISFKEFLEKIPEIYNQSPESAKTVLWILIYRNTWPFFNILWTLWKYSIQFLAHTIFDNRSFSDSFRVYGDAFRWRIDANLKFLTEVSDSLPTNLTGTIRSDINILRGAIEKFELNTKYVIVYKELMKNNSVTANFGDEFVKKFKLMFPNDTPLNNITGQDIKYVRGAISESLEWTRALDQLVSELKAITWRTFFGVNSASANLNSIGKSLNNTQKTMTRVIKEDNFFSKIRSGYSRLILANEWIELMRAWDRVTYSFAKVSNFKDFIKNVKILAQESPEFVKSMFGKIPIFIVAWIARDSENSLLENMNNLREELTYLLPIVWPFMMLRDWVNFKEQNIENLGQAGFGAALLTFDAAHLLHAKNTGRFLETFFRPFIDIAELVWTASRSASTSYKMWRGLLYLLTRKGTYTPLTSWSTYSRLRNSLKNSSKIRNPWRAVLASMILWVSAYAYSQYESDPLDDNFRNELNRAAGSEWGASDKKDFDELLSDNRKDLKEGERIEIIKAYLFMRIGFSDPNSMKDIKVETSTTENGRYNISFIEDSNFWKFLKDNPWFTDEINADARRFIDFAEKWIVSV